MPAPDDDRIDDGIDDNVGGGIDDGLGAAPGEGGNIDVLAGEDDAVLAAATLDGLPLPAGTGNRDADRAQAGA